jgi:general secretion pathway protein C
LTPTHCEAPRAIIFGNDDCLLSQPQLSPVSLNGRIIGFRHDSIPTRSVYALCGIRSGDVWTTVNGVTLDTPDQALELYPRLRESDHLHITLLRDDNPFEVQIDLH